MSWRHSSLKHQRSKLLSQPRNIKLGKNLFLGTSFYRLVSIEVVPHYTFSGNCRRVFRLLWLFIKFGALPWSVHSVKLNISIFCTLLLGKTIIHCRRQSFWGWCDLLPYLNKNLSFLNPGLLVGADKTGTNLELLGKSLQFLPDNAISGWLWCTVCCFAYCYEISKLLHCWSPKTCPFTAVRDSGLYPLESA